MAKLAASKAQPYVIILDGPLSMCAGGTSLAQESHWTP